MRIRSMVAGLALAGATALGGTAVTASGALAATTPATQANHVGHATPIASAAPAGCPSGATCGWTGENYTGKIGILYGNNRDLTKYAAVWDHVESVYNNGKYCTVWLYHWKNYNGSGGWEYLARGVGLRDIASVGEGLWHHTWSNHWCNPTAAS